MHAYAWPELYVLRNLLCYCVCVLTQVTKQLHSQCCIDKEEKHEEETQIPHLQRDNRMQEGL